MAKEAQTAPVASSNEWDLLEEVIVGRLEGAVIPPKHPSVTFNMPARLVPFYRLFAGRRYPRVIVRRAQRQLDAFIRLLEAEGVVVRRPDAIDGSVRFRTPDWSSKGFCVACPRDGLLVIDEEIMETPMAWRCRFFEMRAYRKLLKEYCAAGARWTAAPRPHLADELYDHEYRPPRPGEPMRYIVNECEPVFDAADFARCGRDLFVARSNVTNRRGIDWLRRHLGPGFRIHEIESKCRQPMHIDTTFIPLAPGKVLINPEFIDPERLPAVLRKWDVLVPPQPDPLPFGTPSMCSRWIGLNVLMLDERRVVVDRSQPSLRRALKDWGFSPLECEFMAYTPFGGSFHCATLDVRRRGVLQSYFP